MIVMNECWRRGKSRAYSGVPTDSPPKNAPVSTCEPAWPPRHDRMRGASSGGCEVRSAALAPDLVLGQRSAAVRVHLGAVGQRAGSLDGQAGQLLAGHHGVLGNEAGVGAALDRE